MITLRAVFWLAVCQLPALISTPFVDPNRAWYHTLVKPPLVPPDWLFGVMWGILYVLVGIAAVMVFYKGVTKAKRAAVGFLLIQLGLNACWTPVFFGLHFLPGALLVVLLMLGEGFFLHRVFAEQSKWAARLLIPYWMWLGFATYLTAGYMMLN